MREMENIIKERGREKLYRYYLSLGYDHRVAASLTLFTYGNFRFEKFSMDGLYEDLCKGNTYLPQEELERLDRMGMRVGKGPRRSPLGISARSTRACKMRDPLAEPEEGHGAEEEVQVKYSVSLKSPAPGGDMVMEELTMIPASEAAEDLELVSVPEDLELGPELDELAAGQDMFGPGDAVAFATDEYEPIEEKDARSVGAEPASTFRMTTNTASAGVVLNQLRNERRIDRSMIRIEEMLNYFRYDSPVPEEEMFGISTEIMDAGGGSDGGRKYLYINVQGREEVRERQNIVLLLDVSSSMMSQRQETQAIIATIISKLGNGDKLSLVTYSGRDHVELDAFTVNGPEDRVRALEKLLSVEIGGCTAGSKGIERAYRIGKKNYIEGGNNQVILITDGDLNFGITDKGGLEELIEKKKRDDLFLSVIGTGLYNYKDDKLEALSKHGNGVYRVVNNLADIKKSIDEEYASLVNVIAKDVKGQVEFNPEVVESYRLLGFENRALAREDFTNDEVISEPFGSGGWSVALYELTMKKDGAPVDSGLKYSRIVTTGSAEPATVRVRYKEPLEDTSHELEKVIERADEAYTDNLRLAFIVYVCAEKLRGSDRIGTAEIDLAEELYGELGDACRERNAADLYKLAGILDKSEKELGIGIDDEDPFEW